MTVKDVKITFEIQSKQISEINVFRFLNFFFNFEIYNNLTFVIVNRKYPNIFLTVRHCLKFNESIYFACYSIHIHITLG